MTKARRPLHHYLLAVIPGLLIAAAVFYFMNRERSAHFAIRNAVAIDGQHVLVIERDGFANGTVDRARLTVIDLQGKVLSETVEKGGAVRLHGLGDDVVWLENFARGLHRRRLPGLEVVGGTKEAIAAHPMLQNGAQVVGFVEDGLVLRGKDQKLYVLQPDLTIVDKGRTFDYEAPARNTPNDPDLRQLGVIGAIEIGDRTFSPDRDEFLDPQTVVGWPEAKPLMLDDPESVLVAHVDFRGVGSSRQLSRVTLDGKVLWTVTVRDALDDVQMDGKPGWGLQWVDVMEGRLWTLMEGRLWIKGHDGGDGYGIYEKRLVQLDPETGEVLANIPLRGYEES